VASARSKGRAWGKKIALKWLGNEERKYNDGQEKDPAETSRALTFAEEDADKILTTEDNEYGAL